MNLAPPLYGLLGNSTFKLVSLFNILPSAKRNKLMDLLHKLISSSHCSKKTLERFLGLALWVTQLWPAMRTWLHYLYRDLHAIPASQFSVDPGTWEEVCRCLSHDLRFQRKPPFSAIPINGHLLQVRHQAVQLKLTCLHVRYQTREFGFASEIRVHPNERFLLLLSAS